MRRSKLNEEEAQFYKSTDEEAEKHIDYGEIEVYLFAAVFILIPLAWLVVVGIGNGWL